MSSSQRHSLIPSTPTPKSSTFFRTTYPPPVQGSTITLRNIGIAKIQYIGPIDGKQGTFAGLELQGEAVRYGKNNGKVNDRTYFNLEGGISNSGLFMPWEKLLSVVVKVSANGDEKDKKDVLSSTPLNGSNIMSRSISPFGIPRTAVTHSTTPRLERLDENNNNNDRGSIMSQTSSSSSSRIPSQKMVSPSAPRIRRISSTSSSPGSSSLNLERELKKLASSKAIVESERDSLVTETKDLKNEIQILTERLNVNNELIAELQKQTNDALNLLQISDERAVVTETRLTQQKQLFEDQRSQLFEVIDQVEKQVNENENLYLGEVRKLKEELEQRSVIMEELILEKAELQDQLKLAKSYNNSSIFEKKDGDDNDESQVIEGFKKTIDVQKKGLVELNKEIQEKDSMILKISKESLTLKQDFIIEKEALIKENERIKEELNDKDSRLMDLETEIIGLNQMKTSSDVDHLASKIKAMDIDNSPSVALLKANDRIQELEFKLESKESIINDLKKELTSSSSSNDSELNSLKVSYDENLKKLDEFQKLLQNKDTWIEQNQEKLSDYNSLLENFKNLQNVVLLKDKEIERISEELSKNQEKKILEKTNVLESKILEMEVERVNLGKKIQILEEDITSKNKELEDYKSTNQELHSQIETSIKNHSENKDLNSQLQALKLHNEELDQLLEEMTIELELLKEDSSQKVHTTVNIASLQSQIKSLSTELEQLKTKHQTELETLEEEYTIEINTLQEKLAISTLTASSSTSTTPSSEIDINSFKSLKPSNNDSQQQTKRVSTISASKRFSTSSSISSALRPPIISQVIDGELQVYVPPPTNTSSINFNQNSGVRKLWCGLCERDGHDSVDCPFEIDVDVF